MESETYEALEIETGLTRREHQDSSTTMKDGKVGGVDGVTTYRANEGRS